MGQRPAEPHVPEKDHRPSSPPNLHSDPTDIPQGTCVERYVILKLIARGATGVVYSAFDAQSDRKVAIKILRSKQEASLIAAREHVIAEAKTLVRVIHPNVVSVYDVGVFRDRVFVAMEFIDGDTLRKWMVKPRSFREKMEVMKAAGRGLSAAHLGRIVHLDFTPDNVLLGKNGRIVITNFAASRALFERPRDLPGRSELRSDPLLKPPEPSDILDYRAPECVNAQQIDARSDQYSFCVTLYWVLFGEKPPTLARHAHESKERSTKQVPKAIHRAILKGLSLRPEDRFRNMDELLGALNVRARRILATRVLVAIAVFVCLAIPLGYLQMQRSKKSKCASSATELEPFWNKTVMREMQKAFLATGGPEADFTFQRFLQVIDEHASSWSKVKRAACEQAVDHPDEQLLLRMACLERRKSELRALTRIYLHPDQSMLDHALEAAYGLTSPEWCADLPGLRATEGLPDNPEHRARVIQLRGQLADAEALYGAAMTKPGLELARQVAEAARAIPHPATEAEALLLLGRLYELGGEYVASEPHYRRAIAMAEAAGDDAAVARGAARLAFVIGDKLERLGEALDWMVLAEAAMRRHGHNDQLEADILGVSTLLSVAAGTPEKSMADFQRLIELRSKHIGKMHPTTGTAINNMGYAYNQLGEHEKALEKHQAALDIVQKTLGNQHLKTSISVGNIGTSLLGLGKLDEATEQLEKALETSRIWGPSNFWTAWHLQYLSRARLWMGNTTSALAAATEGLQLGDKIGGESLRIYPALLVNLGMVKIKGGSSSEAIELCTRALGIQKSRGLSTELVYYPDSLGCLGEAFLALGNKEAAVQWFTQGITYKRRVFREDLAWSYFGLGRALSNSNREEGLLQARKAQKLLSEMPGFGAREEEVARWLKTESPKN